MVKRRVVLTKIRTQRFETVINTSATVYTVKDDPDEMADQAWLQFNNANPDVETEYTTEVSKIDQTQP